MNPKITKARDDVEKTKNKIAELQALLPEQERKVQNLENAEIVRRVRNASVEPGQLDAFMESLQSDDTSTVPKPRITPNEFDTDVSDPTRHTTHTTAEVPSED